MQATPGTALFWRTATRQRAERQPNRVRGVPGRADTLQVMTFVNADVIAQGLSAFDVGAATYEASRVMLERLRALAE